MRIARARCSEAIAAALGCRPEELDSKIRRAIASYGHDVYQTALQYAHDRDTLPPRPEADPAPPAGSSSVGAYHEMPATRVDSIHGKKAR